MASEGRISDRERTNQGRVHLFPVPAETLTLQDHVVSEDKGEGNGETSLCQL